MTTVGEYRRRYHHEVECAPSRYSDDYSDWCARADAWAREQEETKHV